MGKERLCKAKVAKKDPAKDKGQYVHYGKDEHWKRNRKDYLTDKAKQKLSKASGSGKTKEISQRQDGPQDG
ncbi:hypothetical protein GW17_00041461 [Ensete ventricosum]|nr:hypothetical protein GW17_00041461 [Ensete ventricosum]